MANTSTDTVNTAMDTDMDKYHLEEETTHTQMSELLKHKTNERQSQR
jgi:hypothetical protein